MTKLLVQDPDAVPPDPSQTYQDITLALVLNNANDAEGLTISGLGEPGDPADAVTQGYVDARTLDTSGLFDAGMVVAPDHVGFRDGVNGTQGGDAGTFLAAQGDGWALWGAVAAEVVSYDNGASGLSPGTNVQDAIDSLVASLPDPLTPAAFVANGSTTDELRDSLIAAGLMASS